ncbi:hypothetical protein CQW23_35572 [Capsicum baccatum]|uniref:Protein TAR1 n=1 Tax=Capsicum baccatum TaxID=33114 RepID=A0A2G2UVI4_CAPBA|nr:hypothetical protein CQW23_35572 [Capsicum baccatum]
MGSPQASVRSAQMPKHAGGARCLPQSRRRRSTSVSRARALAAPPIHAGPRPESIGGPARRRSTSDRGASPAPIRFPPDNFKHSLTLFSKSFSSFPRAPRGATGSGHDGALTLSGAPFQGTWAWSAAEDASLDYNSDDGAALFYGWAVPDSLAVTKGILPRARGAREAIIRPAKAARPMIEARCEGGDAMRDAQADVPSA